MASSVLSLPSPLSPANPSSSSDDAFIFEVACHLSEAPPSSDTECTEALKKFAEEHHMRLEDVAMSLAAYGLRQYCSISLPTSRQLIHSICRKACEDELPDLPVKLEGSSAAQQLEVLSVLEQAYGELSTASMASQGDSWRCLLQRNSLLERENAELRNQLNKTNLAEAVSEITRLQEEVIDRLYYSLGALEAYRSRDATKAKEHVDVASMCNLLSAAPSTTSPTDHPDNNYESSSSAREATASSPPRDSSWHQQVESLRKRLTNSEERSKTELETLSQQLCESESTVVSLQTKILELHKETAKAMERANELEKKHRLEAAHTIPKREVACGTEWSEGSIKKLYVDEPAQTDERTLGQVVSMEECQLLRRKLVQATSLLRQYQKL